MGLVDAVRHAEQQFTKSARRGAERAKAGVEAMEAGILRTLKPHHNSAVPTSAHPEQEPEPSAKVRTGIVSVNGQDVGKMRCTGGR